MSSSQLETLVENYTRELRGKLSADFPYIDVDTEHFRSGSVVNVYCPPIKPSEISKLHIDGVRTGEIWLTGEFYLTPDRIDILEADVKQLFSIRDNVGVNYGELPFDMFQLTAHLYGSTFEMHTRRTIECRIKDIQGGFMQTIETLRDLQKRIELVVGNAPIPLLAQYQPQIAQVNRVMGEMVGQIPLYRLPLSVIEKQIKEGKLPQTSLLEQTRGRQLKGKSTNL